MYRQNDPVPDDALTNGSPNSKVEERGDLLFLITCISYNARYAKCREAKNLYVPESGLFPRPADLQPSVIPYDSTFAFFFIFVSHLYFGATIFLWTYKLQSCTVCRCHARLHFIFPDSLFMLL